LKVAVRSSDASTRRQDKGQTLVEFAMVAVLFLMTLFTVMDLAMMFFVNQTMQHAVRAGSRLAVVNPGSNCRAAIIANITTQSMGYYDKNVNATKAPVISSQALGAYGNISGTPITDGSCGTPQQPITVSLTYSWPLMTPFLRPLFPDGRYTFTVKATVVNEPQR
jgi:Flp pilus assembly protein TadG